MKNLVKLASVVLVLTSISACNTMAGVGKDVERGGEKIQDTAKDVQKKN